MMKTGILHTQFNTALLIPRPNSKEVSVPADFRFRTDALTVIYSYVRSVPVPLQTHHICQIDFKLK